MALMERKRIFKRKKKKYVSRKVGALSQNILKARFHLQKQLWKTRCAGPFPVLGTLGCGLPLDYQYLLTSL